LNEGGGRKLTLVSAPAGFGKTTMVAEWIQGNEMPAAWVSLDEGDNVLARFITYLITAIQQIESEFGADILAVVQATEHPPLESLLTMFVNQVAAIQNEFILVLDDYHLISNEAIHDALEFLLEHLPHNMHLVMIGRVDPPFSLSRLRVGGQLTELRSNDLRFTASEIAAFLNEIMGFELTNGDIKALETRTEGWIASLQLAALSLQGREDKREFIAAFSGSHHYVIDYLVDEVMSRQPIEIQKFLYRTSILERFCAALSDAMLEITSSKEVIQQLEVANLFLIPLDDERKWYRYHHLFADFLRQYLSETEPEDVPALHRRTSNWLEQNNLFPEAINHAIVGEDFKHAAQMIENIGPDMMMKSEFDQLTRWLDSMPQNFVENWPWLCIIRAWIYDRWAQFDLGEQYLKHAETALENTASETPEDAEKIIRGQIAAIRALYTLKKGQIPQSIEYSNQALDYLPGDYFNRGVASFSLGWAKKAQGDLSGSIQAYEEGRKSSLAAGNQILAQVIILDIGKIQSLQGHIYQAAESFREAIQFKYDKSEIKIPYASSASVSLANILREWNELDAALGYLQEGIEIGITSKIVDAITAGYASLALLYLAQGDLEAAIQACENAERMVKDIPDLEAETLSKTLDSRVRLLLAQNQVTEAARYVQEKGLRVDAEINYFFEFEHIVLARVLIHSGRENSVSQDLPNAHKLLGKILEMTKSAGYISQVIETLVLQALAFEAQGKYDQALNSLEEALTLAEPDGYVRTFIDEGEPMKKLLCLAASRGIYKIYVNKLMDAFEPSELKEQPITPQQLLDPLSERELEVLKMLATELSGPEIARELMVSLNTSRTHTKNIYTKLGVNNRRSAVSRAEELKLL